MILIDDDRDGSEGLGMPDDTASILVVDDDEDGRDAVVRFLTKSGFSVRAATNGREALMSLAADAPDLLILDLMMPEMDGIEALRLIRGDVRWAALPVIVITAYLDGKHVEPLRSMGVRCICEKGKQRFSDLLACVHKLRENSQGECTAG